MKIVLIGFMGSGKSSVAQQLGSLLKLPILEMDELVFERTHTTNMHEVFSKGGELLLRETELAIAKDYASIDNHVISTGGGVVMNKIVLDYLRIPNGKVVFLNAGFQTVVDRLGGEGSRPLFKNRIEAEALYQFRLPLYLKYADLVVEVDGKSVEEIVQEIASNRGYDGK